MNSETFSDISEVVEQATGDAEFAESVRKQSRSRSVVKFLAAMRAEKNVSQATIAEVMDCKQSKISKLENGYDGSVSLGDLESYAIALDRDVQIVFTERDQGLAARVKFHAFQIRDDFLKLVELAAGDDKISRGLIKFHIEAFLNLALLMQEVANKIPNHPAASGSRLKIAEIEILEKLPSGESEDVQLLAASQEEENTETSPA